MTAPKDVKALRRAVDVAAGRHGVAPARLQSTIASTIALQMAPAGAAKGGGAIRQRVSELEARLTNDLDYARAANLDLNTFVDAYSDALQEGWAGFTGTMRAERSKRPPDVADEYIMDRFRIKLNYLGQSYCSVVLELVHSEIGSAEAAVDRLGADVALIFGELGLPDPQPVRVISAEHQIVQKLHACTGESAASRAHDLVDIQILASIEDLDLARIGELGAQLFRYRKRHPWPPAVSQHEGWNDLYRSAVDDLVNRCVLATADEAIDFVNALIAAACHAAG